MVTIHFIAPTLNSLSRDLFRFKRRLHDRTEPLKEIKKRQLARWHENFVGEGNLYRTWPPLAESTVDTRTKQGFGPTNPILVRTGKLMSWIQREGRAGQVGREGITWEFIGSGARDGSYAVLHDGGYKNVPQRLIWNMDEVDTKAMQREMDRWIERVIDEYF